MVLILWYQQPHTEQPDPTQHTHNHPTHHHTLHFPVFHAFPVFSVFSCIFLYCPVLSCISLYAPCRSSKALRRGVKLKRRKAYYHPSRPRRDVRIAPPPHHPHHHHTTMLVLIPSSAVQFNTKLAVQSQT